jgi:hypothetical protein
MTYYVTTRDVDGGTSRKYKTAAGAVKRFEEMAGYKVADVIAEKWGAMYTSPPPPLEQLRDVRAVSMFGTVVTIYQVGPIPAAPGPAPVPVPIAPPAAATTMVCSSCDGFGDHGVEEESGCLYACYACGGTGRAAA